MNTKCWVCGRMHESEVIFHECLDLEYSFSINPICESQEREKKRLRIESDLKEINDKKEAILKEESILLKHFNNDLKPLVRGRILKYLKKVTRINSVRHNEIHNKVMNLAELLDYMINNNMELYIFSFNIPLLTSNLNCYYNKELNKYINHNIDICTTPEASDEEINHLFGK